MTSTPSTASLTIAEILALPEDCWAVCYGDQDDMPHCNICDAPTSADAPPVPRAIVDAATPSGWWAYMCRDHWVEAGCPLGAGRGQYLLPQCDDCINVATHGRTCADCA